MGASQTSSRSLACLLVAQTQVVLNDNAAKLMLIGLAQFPGILDPDDVGVVISLLPVLLITPFIALSPLAGWMCDRYSKKRMLQASLLLQAGTMLALTLSLRLHHIWLVLAFFFLFAVQATLFSPAKRGILKELVGSERLPRAVGWMEMLTVTAILLGSFAGGKLFDFRTARLGDPWTAAIQVGWILTTLSVVALVVLQAVEKTPPAGAEPYHAGLWVRQAGSLRELWQSRPLFRSALGIIYFWFMGAVVYLTLLQAGRELHGGGVGSVTATSIMLILLGLGTVAGNLTAGYGSRRGVELGMVPIGCLGMMLGLVIAGTAPLAGPLYGSSLVLLGLSGGIFLVPLFSYLQDTAGDYRRGRMLAAVNVLDGLGAIVASGFYAGMSLGLGLTAQQQLLALLVPTVLVGLYTTWLLSEKLVRLFIKIVVRLLYRVEVRGLEHLPASGGALVICNHVSYIDALILQVSCARRMRFLSLVGSLPSRWLRLASRATGVQVVMPRRSHGAIKRAVERLRDGELVCIFPEGQINRSGVPMELHKGFESVAHQAGVPVIPVFLDRAWSPMFSFSGQKYFWKQHIHQLPCPISVNIGGPLAPERIDAITVRKALLDLGEAAFSARPELRGHLGRECVRSLARRPWDVQVMDCTGEHSAVKAAKLLAVSAALSRRLAAIIPDRRVGIVLPPSAGCCLANLGVLLAGKIPVNLNFTSGRAAIEASLRLGEVTTVLTAEAVRNKIVNFPWPEKTLDLRNEILACGKPAIFKWLLAAWVLPGKLIARLLGLPLVGDQAEAGLLFTSGTAGEPKGVPLTHRNILGNCAQISATGILPRDETLLACLPIFHSFGFTATLWYPLLRGCRIVTTPSPLDTRRIVEVIEAERVTVLIGAPTFLRPLLKKANRHELRSLHFAVAGAEKMPIELAEAFKERLGVELLQGYGLTETTPVTNVNMPDSVHKTRPAGHQSGHRLGSVGRLLPGMTARITDPDTGAELPLTTTGMVWLRGPNVFNGYLKDDEKTRAALKDGWFLTGDLGRFDEDGFLYIEGRLSRFSKIGGEMVPHETVEQKILAAYQIDQNEGPAIAIVGVPDSSKGETLVLLTSLEINGDDLREKLYNAGLPNLWIPKIIRKVDHIPLLGSGKTDLRGCFQLALEVAK
jgi:acyl-[acyl-carrier-protein]-phospholipid O-acyltransferase/long-chain-fatty-acid--[acyl-carrier-protein] ligase